MVRGSREARCESSRLEVRQEPVGQGPKEADEKSAAQVTDSLSKINSQKSVDAVKRRNVERPGPPLVHGQKEKLGGRLAWQARCQRNEGVREPQVAPVPRSPWREGVRLQRM